MIDQEQLEALYDEYAKALYGYLLSLTRREADAANLLQDTFVKLARNPRCLDRVANVKAFLFRMAHNLAVDNARRDRSRRERAEALETPLLREGADPDAECFRQSLESALTSLPEEQRSAVFLRLWGGLSTGEIGKVCGVSENTIASRYRYGLEKLRQLLRPVYDEIKHEPPASTGQHP